MATLRIFRWYKGDISASRLWQGRHRAHSIFCPNSRLYTLGCSTTIFLSGEMKIVNCPKWELNTRPRRVYNESLMHCTTMASNFSNTRTSHKYSNRFDGKLCSVVRTVMTLQYLIYYYWILLFLFLFQLNDISLK